MKRRILVCALLVISACAATNRSGSTTLESTWVTDTLRSLTLEEKVGQMIYPRASGEFLNEAEAEAVDLMEATRAGRIGGVVFFQGSPYETAAFANRLQRASRLPLLMASDYEWGAGMRVSGASRFPKAMALGAGGTMEDIELQAEVTAREARALGVHLLLNPVLDLNTNPRNSVINTRSFGADPERASELGVRYIRRAQQSGVLATAKHFPGHGATVEDSHVGLPVVTLDRDRLESVELIPFRAAVDAGVAAVMTAHIAVPALGGPADLPATLSSDILQGVLRGELGFDGLIVSDALDMGGARKGRWDGEIAVAAVKAGVDMLLVPPDPRVTHRAIVTAVERGDLTRERIDASVTRILKAKASLELDRARQVNLADLPRRLNPPRVQERIEAMAARAVTIVSDEDGLLPLSAGGVPDLLLIELVSAGDRDVEPDILAEALERRTGRFRRIRIDPDRASELASLNPEPSETVLVASFQRARYLMGAGAVTSPIEDFVRTTVERGTPLVFASLGNPYVLNAVRVASTKLATYDSAPGSQRALARVLFGEVAASGRLPVTLSTEYPRGHGIEMVAGQTKLEHLARPAEVGMSKQGLAKAASLIQDAIADEAAPGGVVLIIRRGRIVMERAFGRLSYDEGADEVTLDTLYDLASLTKVIVTTTLSMMLYERELLDLDSPVHAYVPEFRGEQKDTILVKDLLAHTGGLLWWTDLYKQFEGLGPDEARAGYLRTIYELPLDYEPRSKMVYTDLGILLLGEILERITGKPLDVMAEQEIFEPLGMTDTIFRPDSTLLERIAPTERDEWRGRVVHGEVHDENAFGLGGIAPHAGLFSTARSLAPFTQMLLNGGVYDGKRLISEKTLELFTRRANLVPGSSRALGWDTPSEPSSSGRYFSASSFGHTGFTGTSIWMDPERDVVAILLTNRVHPTRENRKLYDVRPLFYDAVIQAITDETTRPRSENE